MKPVHTFNVKPLIPAKLERLRELALNLRWTWDHDTIELFRRLDRDLWEATGRNPVLMLSALDQSQLEAAAIDDGFLAHLDRVYNDLQQYMAGESSWFRRTHPATEGAMVAYFSAEFGVTECLSIFAGGLGVLAGDHLKSASDLGIPLIAVGLLYQQGYFRQYLSEAGWQQEAYEDNDFHNLPLTLERKPDKTPLTIEVALPGRKVAAQIWRAQVGRTPLYLLDTNIPVNTPEDRGITYQLYGGDSEMRIKQEIVLGMGGYTAVKALGHKPMVYHLNEGHSAFLPLERIRQLMRNHGLKFAEAKEAASAGLLFTTHTPVAAGHDYFSPDLMNRYFGDYVREVGISMHEFMALGRQNPNDPNEAFCMTVLALRLAANSNAVSRLHAQVTRKMWQGIWPNLPEDEIPVGHVTNGVHFRTWISLEMNQLYDRYLGPRWREEPADKAVWQRVSRIAPEELWRTHERRRQRLVNFVRQRLRAQLIKRGAPRSEVEAAERVLDADALTIGFARRFAAYKRANLILRDPERLARILNDPQRPVQLIFAGKAHPRDEAGKELIRQIVQAARQERFRKRIVFIEEYDMGVARYLVQGADVWLNTPRRPREASGTSGMKAAANGALNLSTLDGWWDEAWRETEAQLDHVGWAIGRGENYDDPNLQDQLEAEALYELLEQEVVPTFYDRSPEGLPLRWIALMKASIGSLCHYFNTHRMVREYSENFYVPAAARYRRLRAEGMARVKALADWKARVQKEWPNIRIEAVDGEAVSEVLMGQKARAKARIRLGALKPEDVTVELYHGRVNAKNEIVEAVTTPMHLVSSNPDGTYLYEGQIVPSRHSGLQGYTIRVIPRHPDLPSPFLPGLVIWAK